MSIWRLLKMAGATDTMYESATTIWMPRFVLFCTFIAVDGGRDRQICAPFLLPPNTF